MNRTAYLVECYRPDAGLDALERHGRDARAALSARGLDVLVSLLLPEDDALMLVVSGPDAGAVTAAVTDAGVASDRISAVLLRLPAADPAPGATP